MKQKYWSPTEEGDAPARVPLIIRRFYPKFAEYVWTLEVGLKKPEKKPEKEEVLRWARNLTSTNCGWQEYEMGQYALRKLDLVKKEKP